MEMTKKFIDSFLNDTYHIHLDDKKKIMAFFQKKVINNLDVGKYMIPNTSSFFLIQSYQTKDQEEVFFENHQKYLDYQYLLTGEERFYYVGAADLMLIEDAYKEKDIAFLQENEMTVLNEEVCLPQEGILFLPGTAHKPCVKVKEKELVKKLVLKIPYKKVG